MTDSLLPLLLFVPIIGIILCLPFSQQLARWVALLTSLVGVVLAIILYQEFDGSGSEKLQLAWSFPWISSYGIKFALAVDGLSFPLVLLTKVMMPIALLASWGEDRRLRSFMSCFLFLDFAMTGTFLATDLFLFYVFWELMLIPMILLIGVWGSQNRIYAALKFFLFTFAGSVLMLVAILWLFGEYRAQFGAYTGEIALLSKVVFSNQPIFWGLTTQDLIFWGFTLAFLIKVPLFPLHTWLPDAHVQAPTGGSVLLAAVLLKMGTYGLMRFSIPFCPEAFIKAVPILSTLSLVGIVYGAWVAFQQTDMKKLVAYSSVSHLGFVVLGLCALNREGLTGSVLQVINHGVSSGALFVLVGILYERRHSREFEDFGGLASVMPRYAFFLVFVACSSMAVPGLNGFVGEFLILLGAFKAKPIWTYIAVSAALFGALYLLVMIRQVLFGPLNSGENKNLKDLSTRDWVSLVPITVMILMLGMSPNFLLRKIDPALDSFWKTSLQKGQSSVEAKAKPGGKV
ncbi:NADH-quinone oxidoreductase subunit M [bacterium]|nr:NADH-quinone oxidoreductase subunit M [bacterium]